MCPDGISCSFTIFFSFDFKLYKNVLPGVLGEEYDKYTLSVFLSFWIKDTLGTITLSSLKWISSSLFVLGSLKIILPSAFEVSDLMIQLFKKTKPPIKTSSFAAMNDSHFCSNKSLHLSILKSSAFSFVCF